MFIAPLPTPFVVADKLKVKRIDIFAKWFSNKSKQSETEKERDEHNDGNKFCYKNKYSDIVHRALHKKRPKQISMEFIARAWILNIWLHPIYALRFFSYANGKVLYRSWFFFSKSDVRNTNNHISTWIGIFEKTSELQIFRKMAEISRAMNKSLQCPLNAAAANVASWVENVYIKLFGLSAILSIRSLDLVVANFRSHSTH